MTKSNIIAIEHNNIDSSYMLSLENNRLHIWDLNRTLDPLHSIKGSNFPLYCAKWHPHDRDLIGISGKNGSIKIIDCRKLDIGAATELIRSQRQNIHNNAVRSLDFNPIIPFWLATASNDGTVKIWDIRKTIEPLITLQGHQNMVRSVRWSNTHCDVLASGGSDHVVKLWSLRVPPHYEWSSFSGFQNPIIDIRFSKTNLYSLSASGKFTAISIDPSVLNPLIESKNPKLHDVETALSSRTFRNAFMKMHQAALNLKEKGDLDGALDLLSLSVPLDPYNLRTPISETDPIDRFHKEVKEFSYLIPRQYLDYCWKSTERRAVEKLEKNLSNQTLNYRILKLVKQKDFKEIHKIEKQVVNKMQEDLHCIEVDTLSDVIDLFLAFNYVEGMEFAKRMSRFYKDNSSFEDFIPVAKRILSPHVFEVSENPSLRATNAKHLQELWKDFAFIMNQLELQKKVISSLWEQNTATTIINLVEKNTMLTSIVNDKYPAVFSVSVIQSYLNSLLCENKISDFFIMISLLNEIYSGFDIERKLTKMMHEVGVPTLQNLQRDFVKAHNNYEYEEENTSVIDFLKQNQVIMTSLINMGKFMIKIPMALVDDLCRWLRELKTDLEKLLKVLFSKHNQTEVTAFVEEFLECISSPQQAKQIKDSDAEYRTIANEIVHLVERLK